VQRNIPGAPVRSIIDLIDASGRIVEPQERRAHTG